MEETLQIIKNFPWDTQRGSDIQLSGPGIVIAGENGDYLKVALYFNGKFSAYYLDGDNHLYEYHTPELTDECQKVKEFFEGNLNLDGFDKHFFNIGNRGHFNNGNFEYRINKTSTPMYIALMAILLSGIVLVSIIAFIIPGTPILIYPLVIFNVLLWIWAFYAYIKLYIKSKDLVLIISKGNAIFQFGTDGNMKIYNKSDITQITSYGGMSRRSTNLVVVDINFKNGDHIKFPAMLIDTLLLNNKLPGGIEINSITNFGALMKNIWDY
ncbi:MAG: hypothetical protein V4592_07695 [Bacteroidota bacterium]